MTLLVSLLGAFIYSLLPWAIGQKFFIHDSKAGIALKAATGWLCIYLITLALAISSGLHANTMIVASLLAFLLFGKTILSGIFSLLKSISDTYRSSSSLEKIILILIFVLLVIRAFQAFSPSINWDSLNQHLPLLSARLDQQNLDPMYELPTDRRTPISGVLLKLPLYCFGQDGRSISLAFFGFYIIVLLQLWNLLSRLCSRLAALFSIACFISWTDISIYFKHLGDEAYFCLFIMAIVSSLLLKPNSLRSHFVASIILGLCCSIKLTALFFAPFIACVYLIRHSRSVKPIMMVLCLLCFALFALTPYLKQKMDYQMIYPLQRWTNLMEFGPEAPSVFDFETIQVKRAALGLEDHRDNQKVSRHAFSKWIANSKKLIYLPLGPYLYWMLIMLGFSLFFRPRFSEQKHFHFVSLGISLLIVLVCLNLAMLAWNFSPQALTRYLLPLWCIWAIALGFFFKEYSKAFHVEKFLKFSLILCLLFSLGLEGKQVLKTINMNPFQNSRNYWLQHSADGPLIKTWEQLTQGHDNATFYMGNTCIFFMQIQHRVAQVGNEVGWRDPSDFMNYLSHKNLQYFVYSYSAEKNDHMYRVLKDHCLKAGKLSLLSTHPQGEIYKILP